MEIEGAAAEPIMTFVTAMLVIAMPVIAVAHCRAGEKANRTSTRHPTFPARRCLRDRCQRN
jgi:hypothetical protein